MEIIKFIQENFFAILTVIGGVITWIVKRKQDKADTLSSIQGVYDKMTSDVDKELSKMRDKIISLEEGESKALAERMKLQSEIEILKKKSAEDEILINSLKDKISEYESKIKKYENQVSELKKQVNNGK